MTAWAERAHLHGFWPGRLKHIVEAPDRAEEYLDVAALVLSVRVKIESPRHHQERLVAAHRRGDGHRVVQRHEAA